MLILVLMAAVVAPPQPTAPPASPAPRQIITLEPGPKILAAADRLLSAMDYERMMTRTLDSIVAQSGPAMKASIEAEVGFEVEDELITRIQQVQLRFMKQHMVDDPKLRRATALLYARHFDADELDQLAALYDQPIMKKWNEAVPALMGEMMPLILGMMDTHREGLQQDIKRVVEEYAAAKQSNDS